MATKGVRRELQVQVAGRGWHHSWGQDRASGAGGPSVTLKEAAHLERMQEELLVLRDKVAELEATESFYRRLIEDKGSLVRPE